MTTPLIPASPFIPASPEVGYFTTIGSPIGELLLTGSDEALTGLSSGVTCHQR